MSHEPLTIRLDDDESVSGLLTAPRAARAAFVFAHGAGAGMRHRFMTEVAEGLAERGIAVLRYQFRYMEQGSRRPDPPALAQRVVRAAVAHAGDSLPGLPLLAGGKSFGGRMTSQAQAESPLPGVAGLVFIGFPLHPAGKPSVQRAAHLARIEVPMLFLQGTRDALADNPLVAQVTGSLRPIATLETIEDADHSFHVPAKSGRTDAQILAAMLDRTAGWIDATLRGRSPA